MAYELRLEVNIDVIKNDISEEVVRRVVENLLKVSLGQYIELQSVLITQPKKK
jgi:hypothetical protein